MFDVITIGTATQDVFLKSKLFKKVKSSSFNKKSGFPTGEAECFAFGGKLEIDNLVSASGGGATNTAVTFARQGLRAAAVCRVGDDLFGTEIINELKREKVKSFIIKDKKRPTGYATILLSPTGERSVLVHRGAAEDLKASEIPSHLKSRWLYVVPSHISLSVMKKVVNQSLVSGALIVMNPSRFYIEMGAVKLKSLLQKLTVVIVNREEASYLTGIDYKKTKDIFKALDQMVPGIAVMTDGSKGVWVSDGTYLYQAGIFTSKKILDRTGAGDAFGSGFVAGLAKKENVSQREAIEYAIRLGSANATSVVEAIGTKQGILTRSSFEKERRWRKLNIKIKKL